MSEYRIFVAEPFWITPRCRMAGHMRVIDAAPRKMPPNGIAVWSNEHVYAGSEVFEQLKKYAA